MNNKVISITTLSFLILLLFSLLDAQETMVQPRKLIDAHTAGILPKGYFDFETRIYPSGGTGINGCGLQLGISVGITHRLNIGISYGGDGIVGRGRAKPNPYPGALIKYRLVEENYHMPALALGYEHQGYGGIDERDGRDGFNYKSQGFFIAMSKNYLFFQKINFCVHAAVNLSMEEINNIKWPNGYLGIDIGINEELSFAVEYDLALNDVDIEASDTSIAVTFTNYGRPQRGFLNFGVRWAFSPMFYLEFDIKDVLENKISGLQRLGWSREVKLVFLNSFTREG